MDWFFFGGKENFQMAVPNKGNSECRNQTAMGALLFFFCPWTQSTPKQSVLKNNATIIITRSSGTERGTCKTSSGAWADEHASPHQVGLARPPDVSTCAFPPILARFSRDLAASKSNRLFSNSLRSFYIGCNAALNKENKPSFLSD